MPQKPRPFRPEGPQSFQRHQRKRHHGRKTTERGYGWDWQEMAKAYLEQHPLCVECAKHGRDTLATQVDHIIPFRGDPELRNNVNNWQGLCAVCHGRKSAREKKKK